MHLATHPLEATSVPIVFPSLFGSLARGSYAKVDSANKEWVAFGKNILKSFFWLTDMGRKAWINIRLKSLGELIPLPNKITKDSYKSVERVKLDNCKINYEYKVIYVVARKMAK